MTDDQDRLWRTLERMEKKIDGVDDRTRQIPVLSARLDRLDDVPERVAVLEDRSGSDAKRSAVIAGGISTLLSAIAAGLAWMVGGK